MPLAEKLSQEDLIVYELFRHPVLCGEFINNYDRLTWEEEFEFTYYQKEILCDFNSNVDICQARATGKCLHKDSKILNPLTGELDTVKNWFLRGDLNSIISINDFWKQKIGKPTIEPNGIQDCIEIKTVNGFKTIVTKEHPILTNKGFIETQKLNVGDFIAVPTKISYFGNTSVFSENEIKILAHFIAEGTYKVGSITTTENETIKDIYDYALEKNLKIRNDGITYFITYKVGIKNSYLTLLEKSNIRFCHSYNKFIPKEIFKEPKEKISLFLKKLFDGDGWCLSNNEHIEVGYATTSEILARDIKHLLLRFGIQTSLIFKKNKKFISYPIRKI